MIRVFLATCLAAAVAIPQPPARASDCSRTSVGFVPLTDLGPGLYQGFMGGLYPGGSNVRPPGHDAAGVAIAGSIVPLDTLGNADPAGRIVLISIGMSNATQEFSAFVPRAMSDPARDPHVQVIDCAQGGQAAGDINTPSAPYWNTVFSRLRQAGSSPLQAQAVWLKEAERGPRGPFPASTDTRSGTSAGSSGSSRKSCRTFVSATSRAGSTRDMPRPCSIRSRSPTSRVSP